MPTKEDGRTPKENGNTVKIANNPNPRCSPEPRIAKPSPDKEVARNQDKVEDKDLPVTRTIPAINLDPLKEPTSARSEGNLTHADDGMKDEPTEHQAKSTTTIATTTITRELATGWPSPPLRKTTTTMTRETIGWQ
jgi:hypothetical protein